MSPNRAQTLDLENTTYWADDPGQPSTWVCSITTRTHESCYSPGPQRHRTIRMVMQSPVKDTTSQEAMSTLCLGLLELASLETLTDSG